MSRRIVYIHPGDLVELRICDPDFFEANARDWKAQHRPCQATIRYNDGIEVFDTITHPVWSGTGINRRQMLPVSQ